MTVKGLISAFTQQEDLNFLLTNRIPRAALTRFMGWFSKVENPLVRDASIACWKLFSDLDLSEAKKTEFKSLHDCFTRELKPGLRPAVADPAIIASPSDAIIGAHGRIEDTQLFQVKGAPYSLLDLLGDPALVEQHKNGRFVTLRLTSSMYHRFHAPYDLAIDKVTFIHGDVWNVNPIALKRVERLFCKNERAVLRAKLPTGEALTLVPVAAILVASLRLHFLDVTLNAQSRGPVDFTCDAHVKKGDELGWFEHGSTIIVLAPGNFEFCDNVVEGTRIKCGEPLLRKPVI
ncbi:phosphatidylserine decarboxylase [Bradyrhizobium viridifuturi]|jgi:phosphatidylserine decarboxylase|uniref:archaetidylserine decarboxylase n=3 Tax=Nitrobacteraceae TaxID=41294 RepID=UPI000395EDF4|nr:MULTISPECIES: archaetidylserine decarboxylase [Bradyrhizobium]ERF80113.1 MAG: phosphatidylserine decarboxylase [Bradyrhizobium sp. DFCI-1]OYU57862.1 MAG: phosphatidylserine decarboxylase [Bradyrhizobium sp. PARBB1]PSO23813.1 phosphatidylserine decarboxylase [Bradyrhizobium sp. MOS004]QRI73500.1 phosphatidylserine decarboxylase [Bradyrhizobium sp. PSBB068]MBR1023074.1 phosphatidylserine decarboxylase [Bradyrhizobium viridifuturi]